MEARTHRRTRLAAPTAGPEISAVLEGILEEVRWTVTPSEGKDSDSSDLRKTLFLFFDLFCRKFWSVFSPSVVVVDFIGNKTVYLQNIYCC